MKNIFFMPLYSLIISLLSIQSLKSYKYDEWTNFDAFKQIPKKYDPNTIKDFLKESGIFNAAKLSQADQENLVIELGQETENTHTKQSYSYSLNLQKLTTKALSPILVVAGEELRDLKNAYSDKKTCKIGL